MLSSESTPIVMVCVVFVCAEESHSECILPPCAARDTTLWFTHWELAPFTDGRNWVIVMSFELGVFGVGTMEIKNNCAAPVNPVRLTVL